MAIRINPETGKRNLDLLSWGLVPHWTDDLKSAKRPINARAETLATTPMFRDAFAKRRTLIPAVAFYEWKPDGAGRKQPYAIARRDRDMMAFAGVWEGWRSKMGTVIRSFSIITTSANTTMAPIHDRMPVIIDQADWPVWLGEVDGDAAELLRPADDDLLEIWPVSQMVNSPEITVRNYWQRYRQRFAKVRHSALALLDNRLDKRETHIGPVQHFNLIPLVSAQQSLSEGGLMMNDPLIQIALGRANCDHEHFAVTR